MKTVIEMAREAGFDMPQGESFYQSWPEEIERFAELVRADEREACAKLCEEMPWVTGQSIPSNFEMAAAPAHRGAALPDGHGRLQQVEKRLRTR